MSSSCTDNAKLKPEKTWNIKDKQPAISISQPIIHNQDPSKDNGTRTCTLSSRKYAFKNGEEKELPLDLFFYSALFMLNKDYTKLGFTKNNVNIHIRFPNISSEWHIFRLRPETNYRASNIYYPGSCWDKNLWEDDIYVSMSSNYHKFEDDTLKRTTYGAQLYSYNTLTIFIKPKPTHEDAVEFKPIIHQDIKIIQDKYSLFDLKYEDPAGGKIVELNNQSTEYQTDIIIPQESGYPFPFSRLNFRNISGNVGTFMAVDPY